MKTREKEVKERFAGLEISGDTALELRLSWRAVYFPVHLAIRSTHECKACSVRQRGFDWDKLVSEPAYKPSSYALQVPQRVSLPSVHTEYFAFAEPCRGPAWLISGPELEWILGEEEVQLDLYISPLPKYPWTLIYTHESEYGPEVVLKPTQRPLGREQTAE